MSRLKQIETFVSVASRGSLTAAAVAEGVAPGVVSRRLDALEARLGVKLLLRTTRRVTLTFEGSAYLEDCQRILRELGEAEASVSLGGVKARGHLRLSAPAGFGRKHVAPLIMQFLDAHLEVTVSLDLSDRLVDLVNEGVDCAIRVGELTDSSLVSIKLAENRRAVVASPDYLSRHGTPRTLEDLARHNCLSLGQQRGWLFRVGEDTLSIKVNGLLECNDGAVLHEWALAGRGLAFAVGSRRRPEKRSAGVGAGRIRRAADRHLRGVPAAQVSAAARAPAHRPSQAPLRQRGLLGREALSLVI